MSRIGFALLFLGLAWLTASDALAADDRSVPSRVERQLVQDPPSDLAPYLHEVQASSSVPQRFRSVRGREKDWKFFIAPYGWLAGVEGSVVTAGEKTDLDVPFSDLSQKANGGFQLYTEVRWKKWFVAFDGTWATLRIDEGPPLLNVDTFIVQRLFDIRMGYAVYHKALEPRMVDPCCDAWRRWFVIDAYIGARYWYTKTNLSVSGPAGRQLFATSGIGERWDPFLGLRVGWDFARHWSIALRGDVGGFGIGDAARFTWQVQPTLGFQLSRVVYLFLGWRAIGFDTVQGSGVDRNGADLVQHGPIIGAGFAF